MSGVDTIDAINAELDRCGRTACECPTCAVLVEARGALRSAQEREARFHDLALKAHRAHVRACGAADADADCDAYVATIDLVRAMVGPVDTTPTVTSEETSR